jgi:hypothetical protein
MRWTAASLLGVAGGNSHARNRRIRLSRGSRYYMADANLSKVTEAHKTFCKVAPDWHKESRREGVQSLI